MTVRIATGVAVACLSLACGRGTGSPANPLGPAGPTASASVTVGSDGTIHPFASPPGREVRVNMQDACDPATFNAAVGPDTCVRSGGMKFDQFIAQLTRLGFAGPWHFAPPTSNVRVGQSFVALNTGGEVHTFTEVEEFGGGIVPLLNQLSHVPVVAPECAALEPDDFVAPGGTYTEAISETGTLKFQCCIHPWMRLEVSSR